MQLQAADYLDCPEILEIASKCLKHKISPDNVLGTMVFCRQYCFAELEDWCWNYIEYNFEKIYQEEEFVHFNVDDLAQLLASTRLNSSEMDVFKAMNLWVHYEIQERECHVVTLFGLLRHKQLWAEAVESCPKVFKKLQV